LSFKQKDWIKTLAIEAGTARTLLPAHEQDYTRFQVAHNIKQLYKQYSSTDHLKGNHAKHEYSILNNIKIKLISSNTLALKTDK
jgi:hypothetical protein